MMMNFFFIYCIYLTQEKEIKNNILLYNKETNINLSEIDNYFIFFYNPWSNYTKNFYKEVEKANLRINKNLDFSIVVIDITLIEKEFIFKKIRTNFEDNYLFEFIFVSKRGIQFYDKIPKENFIKKFMLYCLYDGIMNIKEENINKKITEEKETIILYSKNEKNIMNTKEYLKEYHKILFLVNSNNEKIMLYKKGEFIGDFNIKKDNISLLNKFLENNLKNKKKLYKNINLKFIDEVFMKRRNFTILFYNKLNNSTQNISHFIEHKMSKEKKYENIYFGMTDITSQIKYKLMKFIGVEENQFPLFCLVLFKDKEYEIKIMKEKLTELNIIIFMDKQFDNISKKSIKKNVLIGNIIEIKNSENFEEFIFGNPKINKVIFIYSEWCSFCIQAKYLFKKLSNQKKNNKMFEFCQINIEKFSLRKNCKVSNFFMNITYLPSIIIIPSNIKNPLNDYLIYKKNYVYSELLSFIEEYEINNEL
jgi:hypothetical protein